jgi:outer membrane protein assembly factor BamB
MNINNCQFMKPLALTLLLFSAGIYFCTAQISEWRPENRTGVSAETGLLKSWPEAGPTLLWTTLDIAKGYSSPVFGAHTIYITGTQGAEEILFALTMDGKVQWQTVTGRAWNGSNPESRSAPTVEGNKVYTCSGYGDLACIDGTNGKVIWSYKASELNKGTYGMWGIAESLLLDGDKVYFSPGGPETMTIALNKNDGNLIWRSESLDDKPGYVSPILVNYAGKKMIINVSLDHTFAVDASNGEILWKVAHPNMRPGRDMILCVTPIFMDGKVYITSGYNTCGYQVKMAENGKSVEIVWTDNVLDVHHGGVVLVNGYIYGSNWLNNGDGNWCCIDWNTGKKMWEEHWNCKGSVISAEGMLYIYDEKKGFVGLLKANPEKFDLVSSFQITQGSSGPFWAHPVIRNGVLYIRHSNALMAYDIKAK